MSKEFAAIGYDVRGNNNYEDLQNYYKNISTPPAWRITSRLGYTPTDLKFITQQNKNIMINEDGTAGYYDALVNNGKALATVGSTNYGYPNLQTTEALLKSMNQPIRFNNGSQDYVSYRNV